MQTGGGGGGGEGGGEEKRAASNGGGEEKQGRRRSFQWKGKNRAVSPAAARFSGRAHVFLEQAAAAGDWGFGQTRGVDANGGLRRHLRLAFLLMSALLREVSCVLPSNLQNGCMEIVSVFCYLLNFLTSFWDFKMVHGCTCILSFESLFWNIFQFGFVG